jgi:hypothetical protein
MRFFLFKPQMTKGSERASLQTNKLGSDGFAFERPAAIPTTRGNISTPLPGRNKR